MFVIKNDGNEKLEMSSYFKMKASASGASSGTEQHTFICVLCLSPEEFMWNALGHDPWIWWAWDHTGHLEGLGAHTCVCWELVKMMWSRLILPRVKSPIILKRFNHFFFSVLLPRLLAHTSCSSIIGATWWLLQDYEYRMWWFHVNIMSQFYKWDSGLKGQSRLPR